MDASLKMWCCTLDTMVTVTEINDDQQSWVLVDGERRCVETASLCTLDSLVETALIAADALDDNPAVSDAPPACVEAPVDTAELDDADDDVPDVEDEFNDVSVDDEGDDGLGTNEDTVSGVPVAKQHRTCRVRYKITRFAVRDTCSL